MRPLKTTKNRVFPRMSTLRTGQPQVNDSCPVFSPAPSMTCDELERLSQVIRASRCFRTCFPFSGLCTPCEMRGTSRFARILVRRNIARAGMGRSSTWSPRQRVVEAHVGRGREKGAEPADKPGSVVDSHSSGRIVTDTLKQPTRRHRGPRHCLPIWSCSRWGLPCRPVARLAVRSYRTVSPLPDPCTRLAARRRAIGGLLSVALSVGSRRPGVTWHRALWSPDFPRHPEG